MQAIALRRIARNVLSLSRAADFYARALGFSPVGSEEEDRELAALLGLRRLKCLRLRSGGREIELSECDPPGEPCAPAGGNVGRFQHIALLCPDIHAAYRHALACGAEPISTSGPVRLPAGSGGVTAVKFRDPEGHPLEFIEKDAVGYDHSAISVEAVERSLAFYAGIGVRLASRQVNRGVEQEALDGLPGAEVDVVTLHPPQPSPHVELLGYRNPPAVRARWGVSDLCADRLVFSADSRELALLRDPDGHCVVLDGRPLLGEPAP